MDVISKRQVDQLYGYPKWVSNDIMTNEYKLFACDLQNTTNESALPVAEIVFDIQEI